MLNGMKELNDAGLAEGLVFANAANFRFPPILLKNSDFGRNSKIIVRTARLCYFGEGFGKNRVQSAVAYLWSLSSQSSLSIRKRVLLAEILEIRFLEFLTEYALHVDCHSRPLAAVRQSPLMLRRGLSFRTFAAADLSTAGRVASRKAPNKYNLLADR